MPVPEDAILVEPDAAARKALRRCARPLNLEPTDLLLVGDGAGATCRKAAGWACLAYARSERTAIIHGGALTGGTNSFAELIPYLHALWYFHKQHKDDGSYGHQVAVVSDSTVTVRCGDWLSQAGANGCLWAGIEWFERAGYVRRWHPVRRRSSVWSRCADGLAEAARSAAADPKLVARREVRRLLSEGQDRDDSGRRQLVCSNL